MPENPTDDPFFSSAQAVARGLDYVSGTERVMGLTRVPNDDERMKIEIILSAGTTMPFLNELARNRLLLFKSDKTATGLNAMVNVLRGQYEQEKNGLLDRAANVISGDK